MAQHLPIDDTSAESLSGTIKRCRSCFRNELHIKVPLPPFVLGFMLVATCGFVLLVHPSRCVCCGKVRIV